MLDKFVRTLFQYNNMESYIFNRTKRLLFDDIDCIAKNLLHCEQYILLQNEMAK